MKLYHLICAMFMKTAIDTSLIFDVIFMQMKIPTARKGLDISQQNVWRTAIQTFQIDPAFSKYHINNLYLYLNCIFVSHRVCQHGS